MSSLIDLCHQTNLEALLLVVCLIDADGINPKVQRLAMTHYRGHRSDRSSAIFSKLPQSIFEISSNNDISSITEYGYSVVWVSPPIRQCDVRGMVVDPVRTDTETNGVIAMVQLKIE